MTKDTSARKIEKALERVCGAATQIAEDATLIEARDPRAGYRVPVRDIRKLQAALESLDR